MRKILVVLGIGLVFCVQKTHSQLAVLEIIQAGIKKVIIAVDLKVQRLQNKTIWLQNAQKTLENEMSKLKLEEITDWAEKQRRLYADYFEELWQVKSALTAYSRVKDIIETQLQMVKEYRTAWALFRQDKNFTPEEIESMLEVYTGMMGEAAKNIDQLFLVVSAFATQMSDAKRLSIINGVANKAEEGLMDLKQFNEQNKMMSLQRAVEQGEIDYVKKLYGL
jgi:hypothetical protein